MQMSSSEFLFAFFRCELVRLLDVSFQCELVVLQDDVLLRERLLRVVLQFRLLLLDVFSRFVVVAEVLHASFRSVVVANDLHVS